MGADKRVQPHTIPAGLLLGSAATTTGPGLRPSQQVGGSSGLAHASTRPSWRTSSGTGACAFGDQTCHHPPASPTCGVAVVCRDPSRSLSRRAWSDLASDVSKRVCRDAPLAHLRRSGITSLATRSSSGIRSSPGQPIMSSENPIGWKRSTMAGSVVSPVHTSRA